MRYRILHIPSGEWVVESAYKSVAKEYLFKWSAKLAFYCMFKTDTYIKCTFQGNSGSYDSYEKFNKTEFEIVPVNKEITFDSRSIEPAVRRKISSKVV